MARRNTQLSSLISAGTSTIERTPDTASATADLELVSETPPPQPESIGEQSAPAEDKSGPAAPIVLDPPSLVLASTEAAATESRKPRTGPTWKALTASPRETAITCSTRRVSPTRSVDGRISRPVAAAFAAHCNEDLDNMSQADLLEVILRAYLGAVGKTIRD